MLSAQIRNNSEETSEYMKSEVDWKEEERLQISPCRKVSLVKTEKLRNKLKHISKRRARKYQNDYSKFGVEVIPEELVWSKWEVGKEHVKKLKIKNIGWKTIKLKFTPANCSIFEFIYPQPIFISAGTSFTMPFTFRPVDKVEYEDFIEFYTEDNLTRFKVNIRSVFCEPKLHVPSALKFGPVGVEDFNKKTFKIENHSDVYAPFCWKVSPPFSITPSFGQVPPNSLVHLVATFSPSEAKNFEITATCDFCGFLKKTVLQGVGKYAQIHLTNENGQSFTNEESSDITIDINFDNRNVNEKHEKFVVLNNFSHVRAFFTVSKHSTKSSFLSPFTCDVFEGVIEPMKKLNLPIIFQPTDVGVSYVDYFEVKTLGSDTTSVIKCKGNCIGPKVVISSDVVNFKVTASQQAVSETITLKNESSCPALFQFQLSKDKGVFRCIPNTGKINPKEEISVRFIFVPTETIVYYRRIHLLIHEVDPLFLDLVGTCQGQLNRPPIITNEHLARDKVHQSQALTFLPPDVIKEQLLKTKLYRDEMNYFKVTDDDNNYDYDAYNRNMDEYFDDGHHTIITPRPPHISLNKNEIWFGKTGYSNGTQNSFEEKVESIQMTNHTRGKVVVNWINDPNSSFSVTPTSCQIPSRKSTEFRLKFKPKLPNKLYKDEVECYISYLCMRDYRMVHEDFYVLPWHVSVFCCGHSFSENSQIYKPDLELNTKTLNFPPLLSSDVSYKTLLLHQTSNLPMMFKVNQPNLLEHFSVKPSFGIVNDSFQIVSLRYRPSKIETNQEVINIILNDSEKHTKKVQLFGTTEKPKMLMSNDSELYFRPTLVNTSTFYSYQIKNIGRCPIRFRWVVDGKDTKTIEINPKYGLVQPSQISSQKWKFTPLQASKKIHRAILLCWIAHASGNYKDESLYDVNLAMRYKVRAIGDGVEGYLKAVEDTISFNNVVCGNTMYENLTLYNEYHCDISFRLYVEQFINSHENTDKKVCLNVSEKIGTVTARGRYDIILSVNPESRCEYSWNIYYEILTENNESMKESCKYLLSQVSAEGVFPTLSIIDVRSLCAVSSISKTQLWRWLNIDHLNMCLDTDPQLSELVYTAKTRLSTSRRPSLLSDSQVDFNFGAGPVGFEDTQIEFVLKNIGPVVLKWDFLLPKDAQISIDYWADSGEFSNTELHELYIQDNKLFQITPQKGSLKPNDIQVIKMRYKHLSTGTHRLPVLFKVDHGKEILLNFIGVTVELDRKYLHFVTSKHTFTPVQIGNKNSLVQLYEIFNGGSTPIVYEVDLSPLEELKNENFDQQILECINPSGEVSECSSGFLQFVFNPIECRSYTIDVPVHILGGETAVVQFVGIGYDSRKISPSMLMIDQASDFKPLPIPQRVPLPNQLLQLSEERIGFGNVPLYSRSRHLVFITNKSPDRPATYCWHASNEAVNQVLAVTPVSGKVEPGQSVVTRMIFCATGRPSFYDLNLVCEIYDELEHAEYELELTAWQAEKSRCDQEFIIDTNGFRQKGEKCQTVGRKSPRRFTHMSEDQSTIYYESPVTLPFENKSQAITDHWTKPEPPKPTCMYLGVTARTHDVLEYRTYFSSDNRKQYIDRTLQIPDPIKAVISDKKKTVKTKCNEADKNIIVTVLSSLLRNIIEDPTVIESFKETAKEQIPLFANIRSTIPLCMQNTRQFTNDGKMKQEVQGPIAVENSLTAKETASRNASTTTINQNDNTSAYSKSPSISPVLEHSRRHSSQKKDKTKMSMRKNQKNYAKTNKKEIKQDEKKTSRDSTNEDPNTKPEEVSFTTTQQLGPPSTKLMNVLLTTESVEKHSSIHSQSFCPDNVQCVDYEPLVLDDKPKHQFISDVIKTLPEFGSYVEDIFADTLANIMEEAVHGEVLLTSRPRVVALPPAKNKNHENDRNRISTYYSTRMSEDKSASSRNTPQCNNLNVKYPILECDDDDI